jgi:serine/threonine-protein kinase
MDRQGREEAIPAPVRPYMAARLSPDGTRVALDARDQNNDIWIWDLARKVLRKLTDGPALDQNPIWTADGRGVIYTSDRGGGSNLYLQSADGTGAPERLTEGETTHWASAIAPDGRVIGAEFGSATSFDLFTAPIASRAAREGRGAVRIEPLLREPLAQSNPDLSPNGRYLVYQSNESGRFEVYVRPFPDLRGGKWQVSTDGGTRPVWGRDGRELFFADGSQAIVSVPVETSGAFSWGNGAKLFGVVPFTVGVLFRGFDVSADGRRFLMLKEQSEAAARTPPAKIVVALNWIEELRAALPLR